MLLLAWFKPRNGMRITIFELVIVSIVSVLIMTPTISHVGWNMAVNDLMVRHENWNGWEAKPGTDIDRCGVNGSCVNHYDCNEHKVVDSAAYTDSKGNYHAEVSHQAWDTCPMFEQEVTYILPTTLYVPVSVGSAKTKPVVFTLGNHWVPDGTPAWRGWEAERHSVPSNVHYGIPPRWAAAKARYDSGHPGPVTVRVDYQNLILASEYTIFKDYSDAVPGYQAAGLLPKVQGTVHDDYLADRAYIMVPGANVAAWQQSVGYANGDIGQDLQGDLHLVAVDDSKVAEDRAQNYFGAIMASWKSKAMGLDPLSKNGIVVVVGVNAATQKISWARAGTGMPVGNVEMISDIQSQLVGVSFDPQTLLGSPTATVKWNEAKHKFKATAAPGDGRLMQILWGQHKFVRIQMADFKYLKDEIVPTPSQMHWILFWCLFASMLLWLLVIWLPFPSWSNTVDFTFRQARTGFTAIRHHVTRRG
jgi:hypothetical protein